jgi:hypothetical protein
MGKTPQPRSPIKKFKLFKIKVYVGGLPHHNVTYLDRTWGAALEQARAYIKNHRGLFGDAVLYPLRPAKNFLLTIDQECIQLLNDKVGNGNEHFGICKGTHACRVVGRDLTDRVTDRRAGIMDLAKKER